VVAALSEVGVPATPIYTAEQIVADPQFLARNMVQAVPVPVEGDEPRAVRFPGIVPRVGGVARGIRNLGPELGEHTAEVLAGVPELSEEDRAAILAASEGAAR
jgi:formyl-CoA transferase